MDTLQQTSLKSQFQILVIGDSCQDVYHYGICERLSPEAPIPILKLTKTETKPGMCLNVAKNLEGLGSVVDTITQQEKIIKHRYVEEKRFVHLLRVDEESSDVKQINIDEVKSALQKSTYDALVISDYNKGFLNPKSCKEIVQIVNCSIPIFVDSKKQDLSCFSNCIIKINKYEKQKVQSLPEKFELIVTLGENGAEWKDKHYPTAKSKLYDVCGAGDTFLASLTHKYLQTKELDQSIIFANKCASISVTHFGNFILRQQDVD